jgi:hypothetical protein
MPVEVGDCESAKARMRHDGTTRPHQVDVVVGPPVDHARTRRSSAACFKVESIRIQLGLLQTLLALTVRSTVDRVNGVSLAIPRRPAQRRAVRCRRRQRCGEPGGTWFLREGGSEHLIERSHTPALEAASAACGFRSRTVISGSIVVPVTASDCCAPWGS